MECGEYTQDKSYNDCIQNELFMSFENILGCHTPLVAREPNKMCNGRYNLSTENEEELKNIFTTFNSHNTVFKCKRPCTTNLYTSRLIGRVPSSKTGIAVIFDRTISVTRSTFSINSQTFLTRLGGSVSSGRTLLWILITLLGASQVYLYDFYNPFFRSWGARKTKEMNSQYLCVGRKALLKYDFVSGVEFYQRLLFKRIDKSWTLSIELECGFLSGSLVCL